MSNDKLENNAENNLQDDENAEQENAITNGNNENNENNENDKTGKSLKSIYIREAVDWVLHIGAAVIIALLIVKFVAQVTVVIGNSMMPTLQERNRLVMEKLTNRFGSFERGDIVVIEAKKELVSRGLPENHSPLIKRVIGIEGDHIQVNDGKVYVNGEKKYEPYINGNYTDEGKYSDYVVPKGHIYVMGDNRLPSQSIDSRVLGSFETSRVVGRVMVRIFPLNKLGSLPK